MSNTLLLINRTRGNISISGSGDKPLRVLLEKVAVVKANIPGYGVKIGRGSRVVMVGTNDVDCTSGEVYFTQAAAAGGTAAQSVPTAPGRIFDDDGVGNELGSDLIT